jgi:hypothetical protein
MSSRFACGLYGLLLLIWLPAAAVGAQPSSTVSESRLPEIADEPKTIDPAALMPAELAVSATHDFSDSSLREVVDWLQDEHGLVVLLDKSALSEIGVAPAEPISDRLDDAPIYLLLDRLRSLGLAWYFEDEILHITSFESAEARATTLPYNVGDLLDAGYELETLETVVTSIIAPDRWADVGGEGVVNSLGDVLFVRQTDEVQRDVQGLLIALRGHGRQTFVNDPPQHLILREKLGDNVSVDFLDTPLEAAVRQLAEIAHVDIRLDIPALREIRVREREPVTLKLTDRKLETVLQAVVLDLDLTWILRDGVIWITSCEQAEESLKTAVYDVRDLCRDWGESQALIDAVMSQTEPSSWDVVGGPGAIESAKPGTVVISHQERIQMEVLDLLETYRAALRASKPRQRAKEDPNAVITVYYRMHANVAQDLSTLLSKLVRPDSWRSEARPDAPGEMFLASSVPDLSDVDAVSATASETKRSAQTLVIARAVLIIRQTRAAHDEIEEVIQRVESGDALTSGGMGGLGGMGGFGGGFFRVPSGDPFK